MNYRSKFKYGLTISVVLISIFAATLPRPVLAQSDTTTVVDLTLVPRFRHIGVISSFSGDDNGNNQAVLEYREVGSVDWKPGVPMTPDRRDDLIEFDAATDSEVISPNPYKNQWRAVVFDLEPNTDYEVRVTYNDPDGVSGSPTTQTATTRNDNPPSNGNTYYVSVSGDDSKNGLSIENAWQTIQHAANQVSAGDMVLVMPGAYDGGITITTSGTEDNYITFESYDLSDKAVIMPAQWVFRLWASYIRLKGFDIQNPGPGANMHGSGVLVGPRNESEGTVPAVGNIIEDCVITDPNGQYDTACINMALSEGTLIQRNLLQTVTSQASGTFGIYFFRNVGGVVIRDNQIISDGIFWDGVGGTGNFHIDGGPGPNSFIYSNYVRGVGDDALEIEGGNMNVAVWGNVLENSGFMGLAHASVVIGPLYALRNTIINHMGAAVKLGSSSHGDIYFYHNTVYSEDDALGIAHWGNNPIVYNLHCRNNIIRLISGRLIGNKGGYPANGTETYDYNAWWTGSNSGFALNWFGTEYRGGQAGLNQFRADTGQMLHGFLCPDPGFVDTQNNDLSLQSTSPCIDAGVPLPGFNDENSPWPYNGSAPDIGAYEYGIVEGIPPYTSGHVPTKNETDVYPNTDIVVHVKDDDAGVDQSTIVMTVEGATVIPTITGSPPDYTLTYNPPVDFSAGQVVDVTVDAQDWAMTPNLMQDSYSFTIIADPGDIPQFTPPVGDQAVAEGDLLEFTVNATDADGPSPLAYSASNLPDGASFDTGTRVFSWTPSYTQAGSYTGVHFEVTDGMNTDYENITVTVTNTNRPPQADAGPDQQVDVSFQVTLNGSVSSDPDNDPIVSYTWTQSSGPTVTLSDNTTAAPTFTPAEAGTYVFSLVVNDGTLDSDPDHVTITALQWPYLPIRVNCGGADYTDNSANIWRADQSYVSGYWGFDSGSTVDRGTGHAISGTDNDRIYQTERYGLSGYRFDLGNGTYDVTLHFAETFSDITGAGQRVFDVSIEEQLVVDTLDIYSEVGSDTALIKTINNVSVTDGQLTIDFTPIVENPEINGIEIFNAGPNNPPVFDPIGDKSVNEGQLLQFTVSATDPENDTLFYSTSNLPFGAVFNSGTRTLSWTPASNQAGSYPNVCFEVSDGALTDSENITITVNITAPPSGGGGGGGGGGAPGLTSVIDSVNTQGRFTENVLAKSGDRKAELYIPKDTIGLNRSGYMLTSISIKEWENYPEPPKYYIIIPPVYNITPYGATFEPPIDLIISYDDSLVPELLSEKNLVVATCGIRDNDWKMLESIVDTENDTIKSKVSHFSFFAILAPIRPASFTVNEISITPVEVYVGENVNINALITNTGDLTSCYELNLKLDDVVTQTKKVTLDGGDSETVSFSVTPGTAGEHRACVGESLATFTVKEPKAPAAFFTSELTVAPAEATLGESVEISVLVINTGDLSGSYDAILKIDDIVVQNKVITLSGGESVTVSFSVTPENSGEHTVIIDNLLEVFEVKEPPPPVTEETPNIDLEISNFNVIPIYDTETGKLVSARIDYQINKPEELAPEAELTLKVFFDGETLEEISLLSVNQLESDGNIGSLGYIPSVGWRTGIYTFQAELYEGESYIQSTKQRQFTVTPEAITKVVSWRTLGVVVGSMVILIILTVALILYRRRDMLRGYVE